MSVESTIVVEFGTGVDSGALVVVELDDEVNLGEDGEVKTSFVPGDEPGFLVHYDTSALRITRVACSSGMVVDLGQVTRTRVQQVEFTVAEQPQDIPHIPAGGISWNWYGNSPAVNQDGRTLTAIGDDAEFPAIGEATYHVSYQAYKLIPPTLTLDDDEQYPVLITVYMETA